MNQSPRVRSAIIALALLLLCAPLLSASAQMQVPKVRTAAAGENQFNTRSGGVQASDEFCGSGNTAQNNMAAPIVSERAGGQRHASAPHACPLQPSLVLAG